MYDKILSPSNSKKLKPGIFGEMHGLTIQTCS